MGKTLSDINREYYIKKKAEGYSHNEIVESIPESIRDKFEYDLRKTPIESHFGVSDRTFFAIFGAIGIVFTLILLFYP